MSRDWSPDPTATSANQPAGIKSTEALRAWVSSTAAVLERWPEAGIAVYVRGASGQLAAARIYDDVDPPLGRPS